MSASEPKVERAGVEITDIDPHASLKELHHEDVIEPHAYASSPPEYDESRRAATAEPRPSPAMVECLRLAQTNSTSPTPPPSPTPLPPVSPPPIPPHLFHYHCSHRLHILPRLLLHNLLLQLHHLHQHSPPAALSSTNTPASSSISPHHDLDEVLPRMTCEPRPSSVCGMRGEGDDENSLAMGGSAESTGRGALHERDEGSATCVAPTTPNGGAVATCSATNATCARCSRLPDLLRIHRHDDCTYGTTQSRILHDTHESPWSRACTAHEPAAPATLPQRETMASPTCGLSPSAFVQVFA